MSMVYLMVNVNDIHKIKVVDIFCGYSWKI